MKNILSFLAGGIGVIFFLGFAIVQGTIGYLGIEYHFGSGWAIGVIIVAFIFRFTLPLTIGTFFGALDVFGWPWYGALLITLPGLLFMIPGAIGMAVVGLASILKGNSTRYTQTSNNYHNDEPKNVTPKKTQQKTIKKITQSKKSSKTKKSFFKKFIEGKLSLALSFWIFGLIGLAVLGLVAALILPSMIFVRLIVYPYLIYISLGIWRSSNNYKGFKIFSILAKIMIVIWNVSHFLGLIVALN